LMLEDISSKRYKFVALIGLLGHPLYFFIGNFSIPNTKIAPFFALVRQLHFF